MMIARTAATCTPALRAATRTVPTTARLYSSSASKSQSNLGLYLSLAGVAGIGSWFALGGFNGDLKSKITEIRADSGEPALNKDEWRSFKIKEVHPYNHDSSMCVVANQLCSRDSLWLAVGSCPDLGAACEDRCA